MDVTCDDDNDNDDDDDRDDDGVGSCLFLFFSSVNALFGASLSFPFAELTSLSEESAVDSKCQLAFSFG